MPPSPKLPLDLKRTLSQGVVQHALPPEEELNFPQLTEGGPHTDACFEQSATGLVLASEAERGFPSSQSSQPRRLSTSTWGNSRDPSGSEKGNKEDEAKLVTWKEDDDENPRTWTHMKKWAQVIIASLLCFMGGTGGIPQMAEHFGASEEVMNLSVCVFVVGFGLGPLFQSPLSEIYGRRIVYICCALFHTIFTIPECVTESLAVLLVFRFLAGLSIAGVTCNAAGSIGDVFAVNERGNKMATFSAFSSPRPASVLSSAAGSPSQSGGVGLKETYAPTLLRWRAQKMRQDTGDESIMTEQERQARPFSEVLNESLLRPLQMLFFEPIMTLFSAYLCLIYGLLYGFFFAYPIVFTPHGFNNGEVGLCFLSILLGIVLVACTACPLQEAYYRRQIVKHNGHPPPEARLPLMMGCAVLLPIGLFIFAGSSVPEAHWAGAVVSGIPFGFALVGIYISTNTYLAVTFSEYSASAMAAKTLIRSMAGAPMPMWTELMYSGVGHFWSGAIFAFTALAMCPIPFVFFFYGERIRGKSRMAS
ncbi:hypothetical protein JCM11641_006568 [Rhodosporidiobolus odoratus]